MNNFILQNSPAATLLSEKLQETAPLPDAARWTALSEEFHRRTAPAAPAGTIAEQLGQLRLLSQVRTVRPVIPYGEPQQRVRWFIRKAVRKLISFYIEPIIRDQNRLNQALTETVEILEKRIAQLEEEQKH
ncbi:MAG: hypothetical protein HFG27_11750 [Provencibacterium sp.]|jgi:hypothetical protein|nr:hypothetical protein [Provencibacterium sp.]